MIERVARGVSAENGWWREVQPDDDGKGRYEAKAGMQMRAIEWEELEAAERDSRLREARAAIEAMKEPTGEMLKDALGPELYESDRFEAADTWRSLITAALK